MTFPAARDDGSGAYPWRRRKLRGSADVGAGAGLGASASAGAGARAGAGRCDFCSGLATTSSQCRCEEVTVQVAGGGGGGGAAPSRSPIRTPAKAVVSDVRVRSNSTCQVSRPGETVVIPSYPLSLPAGPTWGRGPSIRLEVVDSERFSL